MKSTSKLFAVAGVLLAAGLAVPAAAAFPGHGPGNGQGLQVHDPGTGLENGMAPAGPGMHGRMHGMHHAEDAENGVAERPAGRMMGPPAEMPGQVPGFVSDIHRTILNFLQGQFGPGELADRIADATPGNGTAENTAAE